MLEFGGLHCSVSQSRPSIVHIPVSLRAFQPYWSVRRQSIPATCRVGAQQAFTHRLKLPCSKNGGIVGVRLAAWPSHRCRRRKRALQQGHLLNGHELPGDTRMVHTRGCFLTNAAHSDEITPQHHSESPHESDDGSAAAPDASVSYQQHSEDSFESDSAATSCAARIPEGVLLAALPFASVSTSAGPSGKEQSERFSLEPLNEPVEAQKQEPKGAQEYFQAAKDKFQAVYDKVYYGDVLPPVGSHVMSYSRFLELLYKKRIKRIYLMADGQVALIEIPSPGWASDYETEIRSKDAPEVACFQQRAEWDQEKVRYYVELPGDVWDNGLFMSIIKEHQPVRPVNLEAKKMNLLQDSECTPELVVIDPNSASAFLSQYAPQFLPIAGLLILRTLLGGGEWLLKKLGRERKSEMQEAAEQFTRFKGKEYNVAEKGQSKLSTGVSYKDVAGIDNILTDITEVMEMLLGSEKYRAAGAKPPRGILLEGPPGTGKTYLARAMAGEHGVPFFSANGAEFVEMFAGTAAARIRNLFARARKNAPSIVFIDEIDALGRKRGSGMSDPGTQEREAGLLQLLFEMDGFSVNDKVLIIGATNRVDILDAALIRPGRFDRIIYMGRPTATNRKKILQVHVGSKPLSRADDDELLGQIAQLAVGYSGAELANLLNEAAILAVRKSRSEIDFQLLLEAMEKVKVGLPQPKLPDGEAKTRLATVQAGRAVAFALTPGLPPIKQVSIMPRGNVTTSILYVPQEFGKHGDMWHTLTASKQRINAVDPPQQKLSVFELCTGLLVPLYAARATEETFYGKGGATLSSSREMSRAGDLARWLVVGSTLHPYFRDTPVLWAMDMGGDVDPTTQGMEGAFEPLVAQLLDAAYQKALRLVQERRDAIEQVAQEMLTDKETETITGVRVVQIIDTTPLVPVLPYSSNGSVNPADSPIARGEGPSGAPQGAPQGAPVQGPAPTSGQVSFRAPGVNGSGVGGVEFDRAQPEPTQRIPTAWPTSNGSDLVSLDAVDEDDLQSALQVLMGQKDTLDLLGPQQLASKAERVRKQLLETPGALQRLQEVKSFAMSNNGSSFPSPPPEETPKKRSVDLANWVELPDVVEY